MNFIVSVQISVLYLKFHFLFPQLQDTFTLTTAGVYSIHLSVIDKAGNNITGRGIFFYDDISVVDKTGEETKCATASKETLYEWVVQDTNTVQIVWPDRFINVRHLNNGWLYGVQTFAPHPDISLYEDLYGNRTNAAIKNKRGQYVKGIKESAIFFSFNRNKEILYDCQ